MHWKPQKPEDRWRVIIGETPNYQTLQERKEGRVYRQNLDRPERLNSLNATMVCDLTIIWSA